MSNPNFDQVATTSLQNYRPRFADNVTDKSAVMKQVKEKGGMEEQAGGRSLVEPLIYAENTTVKAFADYDKLATDPQTGISAAEYLWSQIAGSLTISGRQEFVNSENRTRVLSLLKGKTMQLQMTMTNVFNRQSHGDGTADDGKAIVGFAAAIENGAAYSVYGGIDSNTQLYWRNQWIGLDAYVAGAPAFFTNVAADFQTFRLVLTTFFNSCMRSPDRLTLMLTGQRVHEYFEASNTVNERYVKQANVADSKLVNAGFEVLMFKNVEMVLDNLVPNTSIASGALNQELVGLNTNFIKLIIGSGKNFTVTPFMRPPDQEAKVAQMILYAQYTMANRALQGRMDDIDFAA